MMVAALSTATRADQGSDVVAAAAAAEDLLVRVLGQSRAAGFAIQAGDPNTMGLGTKDGKVLLKGGSGVDVASALNWYLNDYVNTTFDWTNFEVLLPPDGEPLPLPPSATRQRQTNYTYYLNTCTFSYSLVWADWEYWQKQIDWAAMAGVNLPLASVGVEMTMLQTFARFNVSFGEMQDWFAGPAFLTWFRMGNLQGWGGPLPLSWIQKQSELQVKILARMRGLGMRPVLSAFAGFVPPAFIAKHPGIQVSIPKPWNSFNGSWSQHLLEPTEPLFQMVGKVCTSGVSLAHANPSHHSHCMT
jgi:alpha-N-acetylglucosaminidase